MSEVLIVDRNPSRSSTVAGRLENVPGLVVRFAREELATIYQLRHVRPAVIMLGYAGGDSWILSLLATAAPNTPILAYSDRWDIESESRATSMGAKQLLSTVTSRGDLLTALIAALRKST